MPTPTTSSSYVLFSHDGFGLGHFRRNCLIATALLDRDPEAVVTLVTGLPIPPHWLRSPRARVVRVPPLLKGSQHGYQPTAMTFERALAERAEVFAATVAAVRPQVVVVDRHPYGTAGELRSGLLAARRSGARLVLGLRDVLDEPSVVAWEMAGQGWQDVAEVYDEVLVYGAAHVCDHEAEYGLPVTPRYCGWVAPVVPPTPRQHGLLGVAAGGGGDGAPVFDLGIRLVERLPTWRAHLAAGPYAEVRGLRQRAHRSPVRHRLLVDTAVEDCSRLFARSAAVVQMAGYNSTVEALAAGHRPILVPRRTPRLEQAIRAERLAALGLCDVAPEEAGSASLDEVAGMLEGRRHLLPGELARAGIDLQGAANAAKILEGLSVGVGR